MKSNNLLFLDVEDVPIYEDLEFRTLVHLTSLERAERILKTGKIFGDCTSKSDPVTSTHANFFTNQGIRYDLPHKIEVKLQFIWQGDQFFCFDEQLGAQAKGIEYVNKLLHLVSRNNEDSTFPDYKYSQSILYPSSNMLTFEGISFTQFADKNQQSPLRCRFFQRSQQALKEEKLVYLNARYSQSNVIVI